MKILLVDDDAEIVDELGQFLRRRGYDVHGAPGVSDALQALGGPTRFDVVLTDLRMPDGCGLDVLRSCRQLPAPQPVTIMMSGHAGQEETAQAREEGARYVFAKPVPMNALLQALSGIGRELEGAERTDATPSPAKKSSCAAA